MRRSRRSRRRASSTRASKPSSTSQRRSSTWTGTPWRSPRSWARTPSRRLRVRQDRADAGDRLPLPQSLLPAHLQRRLLLRLLHLGRGARRRCVRGVQGDGDLRPADGPGLPGRTSWRRARRRTRWRCTSASAGGSRESSRSSRSAGWTERHGRAGAEREASAGSEPLGDGRSRSPDRSAASATPRSGPLLLAPERGERGRFPWFRSRERATSGVPWASTPMSTSTRERRGPAARPHPTPK